MKRNRQFPSSFFIRVYFSEYVPEKLQPYKKFEQKCRWQKKATEPCRFFVFLIVLSISNCVNRTFWGNSLHRQEACRKRNKQTDHKKQKQLSRTEIQNRDQHTESCANQIINHRGRREHADTWQDEINHRNNKALRKENSKNVIASGSDRT